MVYQAEA